MKNRIAGPALVILALALGAAGLSHSAPAGGQEERPKFYVDRVMSSQDVKNPNNILGEPDGRYAEIAVGGQMVLLMEKPIFPSAVDDGTVVCQGQANFGMEGWILVSGTKDTPEYAWMPLVQGVSQGGFRLTSPAAMGGTAEGSPGVNKIRISNADNRPILVDAVIGYDRAASR